MPQTGNLILTFDDHYTDLWVAALPLLARYRATATFFVSEFDRLTDRQMRELHTLADAGHEIGCHSLRHHKAVDYANEHGSAGYLRDEIDPAVQRMREAGFTPRSFAYPSSQRNDAIDAALLTRFNALRGGLIPAEGVSPATVDDYFVTAPGRAPLRIGKSVDDKAITTAQRRAMLDRAAAESASLTVYAHAITDDPAYRNFISPAALESLLREARERGLRVQSMCEAVVNEE